MDYRHSLGIVSFVLQASGVSGLVASGPHVTPGCHTDISFSIPLKRLGSTGLHRKCCWNLKVREANSGLRCSGSRTQEEEFANQRGREGSVWKGKRRVVWSETGLDTHLGTVSRAPGLMLGFWRYSGEGDECFSGKGLALGLRNGNVLCGTKLPVQISHKI